jgi:hypothetical protein
MESITFTLMDMIQIALQLLACYICWKWGHQRGIVDTINYFESQGVIEVTDKEKDNA